jgi:hypothetical protein
MVRVCDCCHSLAVTFAAALIEGDYNTAAAVHATGNVNVHTPLSMFAPVAYPVHYAAISGNLVLLKWLLDDLDCILYKELSHEPLRSRSGHSVLAVAALYGHKDMVQYLMKDVGMHVTDISDPHILQLHLHLSSGKDTDSLPPHLQPAHNDGGPPPLAAKERRLNVLAVDTVNRGVRNILRDLLRSQGKERAAENVQANIAYNGSVTDFRQAPLRYSEPFRVEDGEKEEEEDDEEEEEEEQQEEEEEEEGSEEYSTSEECDEEEEEQQRPTIVMHTKKAPVRLVDVEG